MNLVEAIKAWLRDVRLFSRVVLRRPLRSYQLEPALAIVDSVLNGKGLTFAVVMSRQAGKNELSAQLEAYLLNLYQQVGGTIVKGSPTYKPQTVNSKMRLRDRLENVWNRDFVRGSEGYIVRLGRARCFFFSAHPSSNVVGATASVLLECDEAQDVDADKWSKDFAPMAASTNATTVFYGTVWTSRTFLARIVRRLQEEERGDGVKRVWFVPWQRVAAEVPSYGAYVRKEIQRLGAGHPVVKTQYELQEIDEAGRMFGPARVALMRGEHKRCRQPVLGEVYALCIDVAGSDEDMEGEELRAVDPRRDSTVATMFRVDLSSMDDPGIGFPIYRVVNRWWWTGTKHSELYSVLCRLVDDWRVAWLVVDATGVGAGLCDFLVQRYGRGDDDPPGLVLPYVFGPKSKSDLGWAFLSVVETGRYADYVMDHAADTVQFWREVADCEFRIHPGPGRRMAWGVEAAGGHDDMLISAALVSVLDRVEWRADVPGVVVVPPDYDAQVLAGEW